MNIKMTLMPVIASCLFVGNAFCADWKYYGEFTAVPGIKEALFYDAASVTNTNNSIKLWVKMVLYSDLEKCLENKLVIENATKKMATGYNPPITKIHPKVTNAAYLEEAMNDFLIKPKAGILYQMSCDEKKFRKISGAAFNDDGAMSQRFGISTWEDIEPNSNAENLAKILCEAK